MVDTDTVTDIVTGLVWRRAPESSSSLTWAAAASACGLLPGGAWRVPTLVELTSIVDYAGTPAPAINRNAFSYPTSTSDLFWTSSVKSNDASAAWTVNFQHGVTGAPSTANPARVRCVR